MGLMVGLITYQWNDWARHKLQRNPLTWNGQWDEEGNYTLSAHIITVTDPDDSLNSSQINCGSHSTITVNGYPI